MDQLGYFAQTDSRGRLLLILARSQQLSTSSGILPQEGENAVALVLHQMILVPYCRQQLLKVDECWCK
jgi:hypothetical protein